MRKSLLKLLGVVAVLAFSTQVYAVGLGGINVTSALGQVLDADIRLVAVDKAEKTSLVARLASPEAYKATGLEYPTGNRFKFQIESRADGGLYLKVSSVQPINDPFVSLLVELTWSSGRLLREYTFLLDPPGFVPVQPEPVEVQAVAPAVQSVPAEVAVKPVEQAAPVSASVEKAVAAAPVEKAAPAEKRAPVAKKPERLAAPASQAEPKPKVRHGKAAAGTITVKRGDTLNKISARNKPDNVSLERMLVALYRANAAQFDGNNMNRIKVGKILRIPDQDELAKVKQPDALNEIRAQSEDWNAYRQKLASAASAGSQTQAAKQVVTGKVTSSVADKAPVAKESAREVLKLSKGAAPGDQVGAGASGNSMTAQEMKNAAQEAAITKAKAAKEEQGRAALLEKNIKDVQRLAELKSAAEALANSSIKATKTSAPVTVAPQPSLVERIMGEPFYLVGIVVAVLGLGGLGVMLKSGRQEPVGRQRVLAGTTIDLGATPDAASTGAANTAETIRQFESVDPISEADLLLNFGRDAQAEEVLKEALQNNPGNHQIQLKLLGIYAGNKDTNSFSALARQLQDSGDMDAWEQAAAMGRKLEPGNPLYGGGAIEHADSAMVTGMSAAQAAPVNPDMSSTPAPGAPEAMDFEIPPIEPAAQPETVQAKDEKIDFNLDFPVEKSAPAAQAAEDILAGISLNLDDAAAPSGLKPENKEERWHEVATKLDLAKAYQEMGDAAGAREILAEVIREGDAEQRETAQSMLDKLG